MPEAKKGLEWEHATVRYAFALSIEQMEQKILVTISAGQPTDMH